MVEDLTGTANRVLVLILGPDWTEKLASVIFTVVISENGVLKAIRAIRVEEFHK
jgi:hypothetical protein